MSNEFDSGPEIDLPRVEKYGIDPDVKDGVFRVKCLLFPLRSYHVFPEPG
jgi:hypothetical protein